MLFLVGLMLWKLPTPATSMWQLVYQFSSRNLVTRLFQFGMTVALKCHDHLLVHQQYFVDIVLFSGPELNHRCWLSVTHRVIRRPRSVG
jgi:hypothetical protein